MKLFSAQDGFDTLRKRNRRAASAVDSIIDVVLVDVLDQNRGTVSVTSNCGVELNIDDPLPVLIERSGLCLFVDHEVFEQRVNRE